MVNFRFLATVIFVVLTLSTSAYSVVLTTTFASNNGQDGNMFDVNVLNSNALDVSRLDLNLDVGNHTVELYTRSGTWVGNNTSALGWTLISSQVVASAAQDTPTPFNVSFQLPGASTTAFYVTTTSGFAMNYTNGTGIGNVVASNADMEILEGSGVQYAFSTNIGNRIWNGSIHYEIASSTVPELDTSSAMAPLCIFLIGFAIFSSRRPESRERQSSGLS